MKNYKVKIINYTKRNKIEICYPPNPTTYVYRRYEKGVETKFLDKLLLLMNDENAKIEYSQDDKI